MKNYVIVGGSSGIGLALVKSLAENYNCIVLSRNGAALVGLKNVQHFTYDVLSESNSVIQLPDQVEGFAYCPGSITLKPFARLTELDFTNEYKINVLGAVKTLQLVLPSLKKSPTASVLFFSTVAVQTGMPFHASIAAAKGAIEGLTRSLAAEFAPNIRVNAIAPSLTNTPLAEKLLSSPEKIESSNKRHPLGRIGTPEDLAQAAVFLLLDNSSWVTGQIIAVDGGMSSVKIM